jgi:very-short-patch-repair endonuclease
MRFAKSKKMTIGLSKRQLLLTYGFNARTIETLLAQGILRLLPGGTPLRQKIDPESLSALVEGEHYVICKLCGAYQSKLTPKHLKHCSNVSLEEYQDKFVGAPLLSEISKLAHIKTKDQREKQSEKLKLRFKTPEGDLTRDQISKAAKKMQAGPYGKRAAEHLTNMNRSLEGRARISEEVTKRYASGWNAAKKWHLEHKEESQQRAAFARRFILRKRTKPHLVFKEALQQAKLFGFQTEFEVGFYAIDEARPDLKLALEIDGCYWHGCLTCGFSGVFGTQKHDKSKETFLRNRGWEILHIKECEIKKSKALCISKVQEAVLRLESINDK